MREIVIIRIYLSVS